MADLHELIENVQVTLASSMNPDMEAVGKLHAQLDTAIKQANKRLRECDTLLAGGHRSEAIQLAETEPHLLDVVSILDFPELPEWNDFVAERGLTVAPELLIEIATDLNESYTEDTPLERHLRRLRVLSLARAPLPVRLDLLRRIAQIDPGNPLWQGDIQSYEDTRLRQIKDELRDATRTKNADRLHSLSDELKDKRWSVKPPRSVISKLDQILDSLNSVEAAGQMNELAEAIRVAHAECDLATATELVQQWREAEAGITTEPPGFAELRASVRSTARWISEQNSLAEAESIFAGKVDKLERAIESSRSIDDLRHRHSAVSRDPHFELPGDIEDRYQQAVTTLERAKRNKKLAVLGGSVVAVAVLIGIIMSIQRSTRRNNRAESLENAMRQDNMPEAQSIISDLKSSDPAALATERFSELVTRFEAKHNSQMERVQTLENAIAETRKLIDNAQAQQAFDDARDAIRRAHEVEDTFDERARIVALEEDVDEAERQFNTVFRSRFQTQLQELQAEAQKVMKDSRTSVETLHDLRDRFNQLNATKGITASEKSPINRLLTQLEYAVNQRVRSMDDQRVVRQVSQSVGQAAPFELAVRDYLREVSPQTEPDGQFRAEESLMAAIGSWNAMNHSVSELTRDTLGTKVGPVVDAFDKVVREAPYLPVPENYQQFISQLRPVALRRTLKSRDLLNDVLANKAIAGLNMMENKASGARYYFEGPPQDTGPGWTIRHFTGPDLAATSEVTLEKSNVTDDAAQQWLSPQTRFARTAVDAFKSAATDWEQAYCDLLRELLSEKFSRMDPLLRLRLVDLILKTAADGSPFVADGLSELRKLIDGSNVNLTVNWCVPRTEDSEDFQAAAETLSGLSGAGVDPIAVTSKRNVYFETSIPHLAWQWVGWLCRNRDRSWSAELPGRDAGWDGPLYAFVPPAQSGSAALIEVGRVIPDRESVNLIRRDRFVPGQRLFLQQTKR